MTENHKSFGAHYERKLHYVSIVPVFQYSDCERSELSPVFEDIRVYGLGKLNCYHRSVIPDMVNLLRKEVYKCQSSTS